VLALISVPLGGDLVKAFVVTTILATYSLFFKVLLTPSNLFSTLILVDILTNCINVSATRDVDQRLVTIRYED
jgi:hypothetical protein